jgi:uncharacterized protein YwqG
MTLQELCAHFGLQTSTTDRLFPLVRPSLRLTGVDYDEAATNRLGGRPNLPAGLDWPAHQGEALGFVAELDLASLPHLGAGDRPEWAKGLPTLALPTSGSLYFFFAGTDGSLGYGPEEWRVLYSEESLVQMPLREWPDQFHDLYKLKPVRLDVELIEPTLPDPGDAVLSAVPLNGEEREIYAAMKAVFDENRLRPARRLGGYPDLMQQFQDPDSLRHWDENRPFGLHRIGGYPDYIQHDPRLEADRSAPGNATGWELLFRVDSEESTSICWGDVGRVYFLIRQDDLLYRKFENTWLDADCH